MTCWRRLRDWYQAGVWRRLHQVLLEELAQADRIDWDRAALDSAAGPAQGAKKRARTQRIAANRARSASVALLLWSTPTAPRSRSW
jgi:transposase